MMRPRSKISACPTVRIDEGAWPRRRKDDGYALVILLMLATVLLISLTAALPSIYTQGQREREEELIFRGNEYARAIAMYRRQFRRFPTAVKDLLQTNGMRFLRRPYADPMTRKGKWRFIHADASGTPIDSRTFARPKPPKPLGESSSSFSNSPSPSDASTEAGRSAGQEGESGEKSSFFGDSKEIQGAFIVGVASMSNKNSIRVYNNKTRYGDWEFLGIEMGAGGAMPGQGGGIPSGGQQGRPGSGFAGPGQPGGLSTMPPLTNQ